MYELELKNMISNEVFTKMFDSPYLMNKFLHKVYRSKKIKLLRKRLYYDLG